MVKSLYMSTRNLQMKLKNIDITANNLANINSPGYKRELPFAEILSREENSPYKQITDFRDGDFIPSNNPFDFAISGKGFFVVKTKRGMELTRNGKFSLSTDGYLVNENGEQVMGQRGGINLSELLTDKDKLSFSVSKEGEVLVSGNIVDKLMIGKIDDQKFLVRAPSQGFRTANGEFDLTEENEYSISQGFLEQSNISPILEMQSMIDMNKDFESTQKVMNAFDHYLSKLNEVGKV